MPPDDRRGPAPTRSSRTSARGAAPSRRHSASKQLLAAGNTSTIPQPTDAAQGDQRGGRTRSAASPARTRRPSRRTARTRRGPRRREPRVGSTGRLLLPPTHVAHSAGSLLLTGSAGDRDRGSCAAIEACKTGSPQPSCHTSSIGTLISPIEGDVTCHATSSRPCRRTTEHLEACDLQTCRRQSGVANFGGGPKLHSGPAPPRAGAARGAAAGDRCSGPRSLRPRTARPQRCGRSRRGSGRRRDPTDIGLGRRCDGVAGQDPLLEEITLADIDTLNGVLRGMLERCGRWARPRRRTRVRPPRRRGSSARRS
jgi:hypothetical protein